MLETLDTAIGLALLFLFVSLLCTSLREALEQATRTRSADLERGIRELLKDEGELTRRFYQHPLINSLFPGDYAPPNQKTWWKRGGELPAYIPSGQFAKALIDMAMEGGAEPGPYPRPAVPLTLENLRAAAADFPNTHVRTAILSAIDHAQGDLEAAKKGLEAWFNGSMDRVSGWYKRRTQAVLFIIGFGLAVIINIDAIAVAERLARDKALRAVVVAQAEQTVQAGSAEAVRGDDDFETLKGRLDAIGFPIGWRGGWPGAQVTVTQCDAPKDPRRQSWINPLLANCTPAPPRGAFVSRASADGRAYVLTFGLMGQMLIGWLVTAFAVMLGAPFWFDILNKLMVVRATVKPTEKSPDESSEDRQPRKSAPPDSAATAPGAAAAQSPAVSGAAV
ncbi:MAG TPA: hypothetical protein VIO94_05575, partial [Phenylobacterium sp.]